MIRLCIVLLLTIHIYPKMPGQKEEQNSRCTPASFIGWYRVKQSDRSDLWGLQMFSIKKSPGEQEDALILSGFSNQGVSVEATVCHCKLKIVRQDRKVISYGGGGSMDREVGVQAKGKLKGDVLKINYTLFFPETGESLEGSVVAQKVPDE